MSTEIRNPDAHPANSRIKRHGVIQGFTAEEVTEFAKCSKDPIYFCSKYAKVIHPDRGLIDFKPYEYQKKMYSNFVQNRFNIVLACRQSGKSAAVTLFLLWYALFHHEKRIVILANKGSTAREMLARVTLALENVPFFLQPGCKTLNKGSIEFSNKSIIQAESTTSDSVRGLSISLLYLDEFAFVQNAQRFYTSTYPIISSGKETKVIITSTANGVGNPFYRIYEGAVQGVNSYVPFRVDWFDVPGRDEEWKEETIANTSERQFEQEYGNSFFNTGNTLISSDKLLSLKARQPLYERGFAKYYKKPVENHEYIITVDVAMGRGQDYSVISAFDVSTEPYELVMVYRNNEISQLMLADIIVPIAKAYNEALVVVENNSAGGIVAKDLYYEYEYENTFVESTVRLDGIGLTTTTKTKRIGSSNLKDLIENDKLLIWDIDAIAELSTFAKVGTKQVYAATEGNHDDVAMTLVIFAYIVAEEYGLNLKELIYRQEIDSIKADVVPFGFIIDGTSDGVPQAHLDQVEDIKEWTNL